MFSLEKTQRIFSMVSGNRYLCQCFKNELERFHQNKNSSDVLLNILDTISIVVADNCKEM